MLRRLAFSALLLSNHIASVRAEEPDAGVAPDAQVAAPSAVNEPPPVPLTAPAAPTAAPAVTGMDNATSSEEAKYVHELPAKRLPIRFSAAPDSDSDSLTFYVQKAVNSTLGPGGTKETGYFAPLCHAPCETSLRSDTHVFGVASTAKPLIKLDHALHVKRGEGVVVKYNNRVGLRISGWVVLFGSVGAGAALIAIGQPTDQKADTGMIVGGSVLGLLGLVGGLWMANMPDRATGWVDHSAAPTPAPAPSPSPAQ